jgi:hypothetical protein
MSAGGTPAQSVRTGIHPAPSMATSVR